MEKYDLTIIGAGILGTSLSLWISTLYEGNIAVIEMENDAAVHTSGRNTGVIHRPFYLDPERRKNFAKMAQVSYPFWKEYAALKSLPWKEVGTLEVATSQHQISTLSKYLDWSVKNGMREGEVRLLSPNEVRKLEPNVQSMGAIYIESEPSVDFKAFTRSLKKDAQSQGVDFLFGLEANQIGLEKELIDIRFSKSNSKVQSRALVNCAGGNAIDLSHKFSVGLDYIDLHFRGDYWEISPEKSSRVNRNIYTVPKHSELPFLDPHWIVRADGRKEIGPNAVMVAGSTTYKGFFNSPAELFNKVFEKPFKNKLQLFINPEFLKLASEEWLSSISPGTMVKRVQKFIPELEAKDLLQRGSAGIRSSIIDQKGNFIKEAIELPGHLSYHILNYNSPGATGAPAFTAQLVKKLARTGLLEGLKKREKPLKGLWDYSRVIESL